MMAGIVGAQEVRNNETVAATILDFGCIVVNCINIARSPSMHPNRKGGNRIYRIVASAMRGIDDCNDLHDKFVHVYVKNRVIFAINCHGYGAGKRLLSCTFLVVLEAM
jgi:hypothetical protein